VGKTYTVGESWFLDMSAHVVNPMPEAIAEWLHRPLLALTVADIGTAETRIEGELVKWFTLAEAWNAVLLVDEADIFLEKRQNRDLARNGLVSGEFRVRFSTHGLTRMSGSVPPTHGIFQRSPVPHDQSRRSD